MNIPQCQFYNWLATFKHQLLFALCLLGSSAGLFANLGSAFSFTKVDMEKPKSFFSGNSLTIKNSNVFQQEVSGIVQDENGVPIAGANVVLKGTSIAPCYLPGI